MKKKFSKRTIIIIVALIVVIGLGGIYFATKGHHQPQAPSAITDADEETSTTYAGDQALLDKGVVSADQLESTKIALAKYIVANKLTVSTILFSNGKVPDANPDHPTETPVVTFSVGLSGDNLDKTYRASLSEIDLSTADLTLYDSSTGYAVFHSGPITSGQPTTSP